MSPRGTLSTRQRNALIGMGVANAIVLLALAVLLIAPAPQPIELATPTPDTNIACRAAAARALAERRVAGTITIHADQSIDFVLGGEDPASAWDAFAVSTELLSRGCGPYDPIRVDVPDPSLIPHQRLVVEARWDDVQAWSAGRISDNALSDRARRSTYTQPASPAQP